MFSTKRLKFAAFDLETCNLIDDNMPGLERGALGIACISLMLSGEQAPEIWCKRDTDGRIADQLSPDHLCKFVDRLKSLVSDGFTIVTWNGLGFDFRVLAAESQRLQDCQTLAINHVDMMYNIFCEKGWPVGIAQVASEMGLKGKTQDMNGVDAVRIWNEQPDQRQLVVDYAKQDAKTTLELADLGQEKEMLRWRSQSGNPQVLRLPDGWLTCKRAERLPEPDNSWMNDPLERADFRDWITNS